MIFSPYSFSKSHALHNLMYIYIFVIQNISLRGHRDRVKNDAELAEGDGNIIAYSRRRE